MNNFFASALFLTCSAALFIGCESATSVEAAGTPDNQTFFGADMRAALDKSGRAKVRFEGEITATCAKKGCWMDVASGEDTVFVRFLDYGFFVPTEGAEGKRTVVQGEAFYDTLTVPMLKHYAAAAGKSQEESEAFSEPELRVAFTATGVMIED